MLSTAVRRPTTREFFLAVILAAACFVLWRLTNPPREMIEFTAARQYWCEAPAESAVGSVLPQQPRQNGAEESLRVLFIGNSHTYYNQLPQLVSKLLSAAGIASETWMFAPGGFSLPQHWNHGEARRQIARGGWDFVVLQGQSGTSVFCSAEMKDAARLFAKDIAAVGARPLLYMVWVREDISATQEAWTASYLLAGRALGIPVAPVGLVWQELQRSGSRDYRFREPDGNHATKIGSFVGALVIAAKLASETPERIIDAAELRAPELLVEHGVTQEQAAEIARIAGVVIAGEPQLDPLQISPEDPGGLPFLGAVYFQHSHFDKARSSWERYLQEEGESEAVRRALAAIPHG